MCSTACQVLLATLCVPIEPATSESDRFLLVDDQSRINARKLAALLRMAVPPSRVSLLRDLASFSFLSVLSGVPRDCILLMDTVLGHGTAQPIIHCIGGRHLCTLCFDDCLCFCCNRDDTVLCSWSHLICSSCTNTSRKISTPFCSARGSYPYWKSYKRTNCSRSTLSRSRLLFWCGSSNRSVYYLVTFQHINGAIPCMYGVYLVYFVPFYFGL